MKTEGISAQHELDGALRAIDERNVQIEDQNSRYNQVRDVGNRALRHIVKLGINDEQIDSFLGLLSAASAIPYEEISAEVIRLDQERERIQAQSAIANDSLAADLDLAKRLTLRRQDELDDAYRAEQEKLYQQQIGNLNRQYETSLELLEKSGTAWPIPQAIPPADRTMLYDLMREESDSETLQIEDIIPVTPEDHKRNAQIAERARRIVDNPQLSNMVLFYLTERQAETVTVEDLIRFCYALDTDGGNHYRSRITTTLGPKVAGLKKQEELYLDGQALQYGWRYAYQVTANGRRITRRRTRIYRVVDIHHGAEQEDQGEVGSLSVVDEWSAIETPMLGRGAGENTHDDIEEQAGASNIEREQTWQEKLEIDINAAITNMQNAFLFSKDEDEFKGGMIRSMTASARIGTKTSYELLVAAGVMRRDRVKWDTMSRRQIAISYVLNSHPELSGERGKKQQKEALAIVDQAIERRLSELG